MLENCNKCSPPNRAYFDRKSASNGLKNIQEYGEFFLKATKANKIVIIRAYGRRPGGIGEIPATQQVLKFLEYHKDCRAPEPYCQIQGQEATIKGHDDLHAEFRKVPNERTYVANVLGFPLMHSPLLQKEITFPTFLNGLDILQHTTESADDFHKHRTKARSPVDCGFAVVSYPWYRCKDHLPPSTLTSSLHSWSCQKVLKFGHSSQILRRIGRFGRNGRNLMA